MTAIYLTTDRDRQVILWARRVIRRDSAVNRLKCYQDGNWDIRSKRQSIAVEGRDYVEAHGYYVIPKELVERGKTEVVPIEVIVKERK